MSAEGFWQHPLDPIGQRLKTEIERLGYDAKSIVKSGYVSDAALVDMLHGKFRTAESHIFSLANLGVSFDYVLTGKYIGLNDDESDFLANYRKADDHEKNMMEETCIDLLMNCEVSSEIELAVFFACVKTNLCHEEIITRLLSAWALKGKMAAVAASDGS
jgi:hypothetical protein